MPKEKGDSRDKSDNGKKDQRDKSQLENASTWVDDALTPQKDDEDEKDEK